MDEKNRKRRTNEEKNLYASPGLRYSVESNRSWESSLSPGDTKSSQERRSRAASLNQADRSASFTVPTNRPRTFGNEYDIQRNSDVVRYSPMSPTEPPQIPLPVPGQYQSTRTSLDNSSKGISANSSSVFRKPPSIDSLRGLSLNDQRRDSISSINSPTISESSFSTRLLKVKVFYGSDIFVIALPGVCSFRELLSKIERKIQLAGTNLPENHPFRLRYKDEDGDFIQIFGDDDLILAFEVCTHLGGSNKGVMHLFVE